MDNLRQPVSVQRHVLRGNGPPVKSPIAPVDDLDWKRDLE
jgi:hypothetical protein